MIPNMTGFSATDDPRCGYAEDPAEGGTGQPCSEPATWHIAWRLAGRGHGAECGFVCDPHMTIVQDVFVYEDRHQVGVSCGMPGTRWFRSWLSDAGCAVRSGEETTT